ncbi:MAG: EamA family transporter [Planctomycetota bacterium]
MLVSITLIVLTIGLGTFGQLLLKWQVAHMQLPAGLTDIPAFIVACILNPWIWLIFFMGLAMFMSWTMVLARLPLSFAYPFTSVTYVMVLLLSMVFFRERPAAATIVGTLVIVVGVVIIGLGSKNGPSP